MSTSLGIDSSKAALAVALPFSSGLPRLIFASTNVSVKAASRKPENKAANKLRYPQRRVASPFAAPAAIGASGDRSVSCLGLAFHKRRAVALSDCWLLVPIAEAAVSAAVGSDRRGSRITWGEARSSVTARPWPDQPSLAGGATTCVSPMSAGGLPELEDGLLEQQTLPLFSVRCSKGN